MTTTSDDLKQMVKDKLVDSLMLLDTLWDCDQICEMFSISDDRKKQFLVAHMDSLIGDMITFIKKRSL